MVEESGAGEMTAGLLGEYDGLKDAKMARTPRTGPQGMSYFHQHISFANRVLEDMVMAEARNLRALTAAQTPLLGDENTPLHTSEGTGFSGVTPRANVAFTPNPLATPRSTNGTSDPNAATPLRLPGRDTLGINTPVSSVAAFDQTPVHGRMGELGGTRALKLGFESLPKPQNDFSIMLPEEDDIDAEEKMETVEDAAERDRRLKREKEEQERREFARRSLPVQKGCLRPVNVNLSALRNKLDSTEDENAPSEAQRLINEELAKLAAHDSISFPLPGTIHTGSMQSSYVPPDDKLVAEAKAMVEQEMAASLGYPNASTEKIAEGVAILAKDQEEEGPLDSWASIRASLVFDANKKLWVDQTKLDEERTVAGIRAQYTTARETMAREAARSLKVEKKLGLILGGYQTRASTLQKKLEDGFVSLVSLQSDLKSFEELKAVEGAAGPTRLESLVAEVGKLERREGTLQGRYKELLGERDRLVGSIAELEDKLQEAMMDGMNVDA